MRAILSVSNKSGLVDFARQLQELKIEIFSTGGTKKSLSEAGLKIHGISDITGFPEILDGRVKTLHPMVMAAYWRAVISPSTWKNWISTKSGRSIWSW